MIIEIIMKHRPCWNCLALMLWNEEKKRWDCRLCGCSIETKLRKNCPGYIS